MASSGAEPLSRLRSLVSKVLGGADSTDDTNDDATRQDAGDQSVLYEGQTGQNWLSHFTTVAPNHIKRWTNSEDGTGNIPYEQLIENLQQFNIPARHVSQYTVGQLLGVEPPPQENPVGEEKASCPADKVPQYTPRCHKLSPQAAAYLGTKQDPAFTQVVPVRAVTKAFVGPVREKVGSISGESSKLLKRPGETSDVPSDYVEVVGSKHVSPVGCDINVNSRESSEVSGLEAVAGPIASELTCHKPPPIYLEPVLASKREASSVSHGLATTTGSSAAAEYVASIPKHISGKIDLGDVRTREGKEVYDALKRPVVYTMGTYVWSKEQAEEGAAHPVDPPAIDACFGKLCEEMFSPKQSSGSSSSAKFKEPTKEEIAAESASLGIPEILQLCKNSRDQLTAFADTVVEVREDPTVGGQGLFATSKIKKGQVVFVEKPLFTCDIESESMWATFIGLTDDQRATLESLQGFHSDLSQDESLWCILTARANNRIDMAKQFMSFLAKMKRNAHGLPTQARWGLYPKASMVNHSCEPNVTYRNLDGLLVYFATRDISPSDIISMTYIDQLYSSASFRSKRLLQAKCFACRCTRCKSCDEKERRMLCPSCRPIKLKIVDPGAEVPAVPPAAELSNDKSCADSVEQPKSKSNANDSQLEAWSSEGEDTSAQASDDDSKGALQTSDDEDQSVAASSEQAWGAEDSCTMSDGGLAASESGEVGGSDSGEASDEETQGYSNDSDRTSNGDRQQEVLSEDKTQKDRQCSTADAKGAPGSLILSISSMETSAKGSTDWGIATSDDEQTILSEAEAAPADAAPVNAPQLHHTGPLPMYCQRSNNGVWVCHTCKGRFADDDMPIGMEAYFERLYLELQNKFNMPNSPQWTVDVSSLIKSIEVVLGTQHWLYAACNLLLAQLYLGQWVGGMVRDAIFDRSLKHAEVFMNFVETVTKEALHVDCAPLAASLMRILLFNGRWIIFEEWVEKGRLDIVRDCLGEWDETFISFSQAHEYLKSCRSKGDLPQLSVLHRYAHTAQYSIVKAAEELAEKEAQRKKALEDAAREKERQSQVEWQRLRELEERNQRLRERVERLKAEACGRPNKIKDVTGSHPDGVLAKFMLAGVDDCVINDAAIALQRAHQYAQDMQEAAVKGGQLYPGNMAADMAYLPPHGIMPSSYLPLIMLDDPLRAIPEKRNQARKRRAEAIRERALLEALSAQQDLDFEEDESVVDVIAEETEAENENKELTMIYRIPGLPGTAPGEFVNVSQLVHDEKGNHAPLPLFKSFFYIDTAERKRKLNPEHQSGLTVLGSSSVPPTLPEEKLEDIEAAKYNYLHKERETFEKDVKAGVLLAAAEAGALEDGTKLVDVVDATNKVIRSMAIQEARTERALEAARYSLKGLEPPNRPFIATEMQVSPNPCHSLNAKLQADTTVGLGKGDTPQEPKPSPRVLATMPTVWEYVPSQDPEKGPTVFLYPPSQPQPAVRKDLSSTEYNNGDLTEAFVRNRIIKPLDFSRIPPPPSIEALVGPLGNNHQHYKLSRMNMMLKRYASPRTPTNDS